MLNIHLLTNENRDEEKGEGHSQDGRGNVQQPVGGHGEQPH